MINVCFSSSSFLPVPSGSAAQPLPAANWGPKARVSAEEVLVKISPDTGLPRDRTVRWLFFACEKRKHSDNCARVLPGFTVRFLCLEGGAWSSHQERERSGVKRGRKKNLFQNQNARKEKARETTDEQQDELARNVASRSWKDEDYSRILWCTGWCSMLRACLCPLSTSHAHNSTNALASPFYFLTPSNNPHRTSSH